MKTREAVVDDPQPVGTPTKLLIAVVLIPIVVEAVRVLTGLGSSFHATADNAINELIVRDVGHHAVLLGPFSRDGWSHPGPLFYYLAWLPYHLFGSNSSAMLVVALIVNGAAIATMIAVAKRWGGLVLAVPVALTISLLMANVPNGFLEDPWNPYVSSLAFGAFIVVAWAAVCGDRFAFAGAVFVGSFCMQTHVGYAPLVLALLAWCVVLIVKDRRRRGLSALLWGAGTAVVLWCLPVIEQLTRNPGNLTNTIRYFRDSTEPTHTLGQGLRVINSQFVFRPDWIVGRHLVNPFSGEPEVLYAKTPPIPWLLAFFLVALVIAFRSRRRVDTRLGTALLLTLAVGAYAVGNTIGNMFEYRLRWVWVLAALTIAFTIAVFARWIGARAGRTAVRVAGVGIAVGILALTTIGIAHATTARPPSAADAAIGARLSRAVMRQIPHRGGVVVLEPTSFVSFGDFDAMMVYLESHGIRAVTPDGGSNRLTLGSHRIFRKGERVREWLVLASNEGIEDAAKRPGARLVAYVGNAKYSERPRLLRRFAALRRASKGPISASLVPIGHRLQARAIFAVTPPRH